MARKKNNRKLRSNILLIVEGKTEQNYFEGLKMRLPRSKMQEINIIIKQGKSSNAVNFVREAIKIKKNLDLEKVFVVFDDDNFLYKKDAFDLAEKNDIKIVYTSICFELWLLLHKKYTTASEKSCNDLIKKLKAYFPNFKKGVDYDDFYVFINQAVINSEKLFRWNNENKLSEKVICKKQKSGNVPLRIPLFGFVPVYENNTILPC